MLMVMMSKQNPVALRTDARKGNGAEAMHLAEADSKVHLSKTC